MANLTEFLLKLNELQQIALQIGVDGDITVPVIAALAQLNNAAREMAELIDEKLTDE